MVTQPLRWTIRDLNALPDDGGWKRYEIIDGELYVTRAPHIQHQGAGGNLHVELEIWSRQTQLGRAFQTPGVILSPIDAVIPDVVWISQARLATGVDEAGHLTVAPELMIEVLSPSQLNEQVADGWDECMCGGGAATHTFIPGLSNTLNEQRDKLKLYSLHGVQEYWIVSWQLKTLEVYRRMDAQLQLVATLLAGDALTSPLLPGFSMAVTQVFL